MIRRLQKGQSGEIFGKTFKQQLQMFFFLNEGFCFPTLNSSHLKQRSVVPNVSNRALICLACNRGLHSHVNEKSVSKAAKRVHWIMELEPRLELNLVSTLTCVQYSLKRLIRGSEFKERILH